jgi:hypothetical protein
MIWLSTASSLISIKAYSDGSSKDEGRSAFFFTLTLVSILATSMIAYISTGSNPHFASNSASDRQDFLKSIEERYQKLADALLDYSKDPSSADEARRIAQDLSIDEHSDVCKRFDPKAKSVYAIVEPLHMASCAIKNEPFPQEPSAFSRIMLRSHGLWPVRKKDIAGDFTVV